jgi:DnaJ domain
MPCMDPFAVLGVTPSSSAGDIAAAYRRLAKRWHPDRGGGAHAERRMAEINTAYAVLRERAERAGSPMPAPPPRRRGSWLAPATRRALGAELLSVLDPDEPVPLVVPCTTWASPKTLLAVTDRRLLWLLDDAPTNRVRTLKLTAVTGIEHRLRWPLRRTAVVRVSAITNRRFAFSDLPPGTAMEIVRRVREGAPSASAGPSSSRRAGRRTRPTGRR